MSYDNHDDQYDVDDSETHQNYCRECALKKVAEIKSLHPKTTVYFDGGYDPGHEVENIPECTKCAKALSGYLLETRIGSTWTDDEKFLNTQERWDAAQTKFP